jgi:dihydropteroate synthase
MHVSGSMIWRCRGRSLDLSSPQVMGILNITPDSFSDGGRFRAPEAAFARAVQMAGEGAAILDIGGESTRPGAERVGADEQIERVAPVIERITRELDVAISIDTSDPAVMQAAVQAGAIIVNDVSALRLPGARETCAAAGVGVCLMHMLGEPRSMQDQPHYGDVLQEVSRFLQEQRAACVAAGIAPEAVVLDPGLGFGKTFVHNMTLLKEMPALTRLGSPLLIGVSRKSFVGRMLDRPVQDRLYGGLGLAALAVSQGVRIIRTHDVAPTVDAIGAVAAVMQGKLET